MQLSTIWREVALRFDREEIVLRSTHLLGSSCAKSQLHIDRQFICMKFSLAGSQSWIEAYKTWSLHTTERKIKLKNNDKAVHQNPAVWEACRHRLANQSTEADWCNPRRSLRKLHNSNKIFPSKVRAHTGKSSSDPIPLRIFRTHHLWPCQLIWLVRISVSPFVRLHEATNSPSVYLGSALKRTDRSYKRRLHSSLLWWAMKTLCNFGDCVHAWKHNSKNWAALNEWKLSIDSFL